MLKPRLASLNHEEVFLQRYQRLRLSALQLTQHDLQLAEDLLHDVFVQFCRRQPNLKAIENLDGYLHTMLRNMHLSQLRRTSRLREATRTLLDYESATAGLETLQEQTRSQARDELLRICEYALIRKNTSKAASVLILRYFHTYYPTEIAKVLRRNRNFIDQALKSARAEARSYLADPNSLSFINDKPKAEPLVLESSQETDDVLLDIRDLIFRAPSGECFSRADLHGLFRLTDADGPDCNALAHIVSCKVCLDVLNEILGLPLLSARNPENTRREPRSEKKSAGGPPAGGSGAGAGGGEMDEFLRRSRRRVKNEHEHHPQELRISVNGFIVGAHSVNSESSKLRVAVNLEERISFVEVFSEQEVRLLFCDIEPPPDGPGAYRELVRLSEGRTLELSLDFADSHPEINVTYNDPTYRAVPASQSESSAFGDRPQASLPMESRLPKLKRFCARVTSLTQSLWARLVSPRFWLRPGIVTMLFAFILVASLTLTDRWTRSPAVTASGLLQRATVAEEAEAARIDQILHRTITLEERRVAQTSVCDGCSGALIARHKIEVWQSAERGVTARRLYDERGSLIMGDWRRSGGVQTIYHHGSNPKLQLRDQQSAVSSQRSTISNLDNVWHFEPSAKDFRTLIGSADTTVVEDRGMVYVLSYNGADQQAGIIKATLTLSKADLHATQLFLVVASDAKDEELPAKGKGQRTDRPSEIARRQLHEFRFTESSYERRTPSSVAPAVFEPEKELLGDTGTRRSGDTATISASPLLPIIPSPVLATADLEIKVLQLLSGAGADLGEQVSVTRTSEGLLRVDGIVETPQRKEELLRALAPVKNNPAVRTEISTVAEAVARQRPNPASAKSEIVESPESIGNTVPADADLRRYFASKGIPQATMDEEIRQFSRRVTGRSSQIVQRAWTLKRLTERFSSDDLRTMSPEARSQWLSMIRRHANALGREIVLLRQEIQPVFNVNPSVAGSEGDAITDDASLVRAMKQMAEFSATTDAVVRSAFTVSPSASRAAAIRSPEFWSSLKSIEALAMRMSDLRF